MLIDRYDSNICVLLSCYSKCVITDPVNTHLYYYKNWAIV